MGAYEQLRASRDAAAILVLDGAMGTELLHERLRSDAPGRGGRPLRRGHRQCCASRTAYGRWSPPEWGFVDVDPDQLEELAGTWIELGATMVGGCCGLGTRHVAALRAAVDARMSA